MGYRRQCLLSARGGEIGLWQPLQVDVPRVRRFSLTPARAAQALSVLIHEGKIKFQDVTLALQRREAMIRDLRKRLLALEEGVAGAASGITRRRGRKAASRARKVVRRAKPISKAQRAVRQAQGRYLGAIRQLPKASRARIKALRSKSGVRAAIAEANRMTARKSAATKGSEKRPGRSRSKRAGGGQSKPAPRKEAQAAATTTA